MIKIYWQNDLLFTKTTVTLQDRQMAVLVDTLIPSLGLLLNLKFRSYMIDIIFRN